MRVCAWSDNPGVCRVRVRGDFLTRTAMLPRVNVVVPTDVFYALSTDEARQLNDDGGDMITAD